MNKITIKTHILLVCNVCGLMRITRRTVDEDIKAVYAKIECPECNLDNEGSPEYYGDNGYIKPKAFITH